MANINLFDAPQDEPVDLSSVDKGKKKQTVHEIIRQTGLEGFGRNLEGPADPTAPLSTISGGPPSTFSGAGLIDPLGFQVVETGMKKAALTLSKVPANVIGMGAEGQFDKLNKLDPLYKANQWIRKKLFNIDSEDTTEVLYKRLIDKLPEDSDEFIKQVRTGLPPEEGTILYEYEKDMKEKLGISLGDERLIQVWGGIDPTEAKSGAEFFADIGRLMASQTEIFTHLAMPGATGFAGIQLMIRESSAQSMKYEHDIRGIPYVPEDNADLLDLSSSIQSVEEVIIGKGITLAGAMGKSAFRFLPHVGKLSPTKANIVTKSVLGQGLNVVIEGEEERIQSRTDDYFINLALKRYSEKNGQPVKLISKEESKKKAQRAAKTGYFTAAGVQSVGIAPSIVRTTQEVRAAEYQKKIKEKLSSMTPEEQAEATRGFKDSVDMYNQAAIDKTDKELRTALQIMEEGDFLKMAQDLGIPANLDRDSAVELLMDQRSRLPGYMERTQSNLVEILEQAEMTDFQKNMHKWGAMGDVTQDQMLGVKAIFEIIAQDSGFDSVDDFFARNIELSGGNTFINFQQAFAGEPMDQSPIKLKQKGEWYVWGHNAFNIELADEIIVKNGKKPVQVDTATLRQLQSKLVEMDPDKIMEADYINYPVIIGTTKYGGHMLIDGNHRAERAIADGVESVDAIILTFEETKQIAHPDSNLIFGEEQVKFEQAEDRLADTKIVNEDGSPRIMYHGTSEQWDLYDLQAERATTAADPAIYLTDSREEATLAGSPSRKKSIVKEFYVDARNPMTIDAKGTEKNRSFGLIGYANLIEKAKNAGHDSVIINNIVDFGDVPTQTVIVFSPNQIVQVEQAEAAPKSSDILSSEEDAKAIAAQYGFQYTGKVEGKAYGLDNTYAFLIPVGKTQTVESEDSEGRDFGGDGFSVIEGQSFKEAFDTYLSKQSPEQREAVMSLQQASPSAPLTFNQFYRIKGKLQEKHLAKLEGLSMDEVWEKYGLWVDTHGTMRIELTPDKVPELVPPGEYTLGELLSNSKLFKLMPEIKDIPVVIVEREVAGIVGSYAPPYKQEGIADLSDLYGREEITIGLPKGSRSDALQHVLVHEVQHIIQNRQGAQGGGSSFAGFSHYQKLPGEVEARLVSARTEMSRAGRKAEPPWVTLGKMLKAEGYTEIERKTFFPQFDLFQKGRTLLTGSTVIRGQTISLAEGKFVIDLFKTGDMVTLAHEFAHVFSPYMTPELVDTVIDATIKRYYSKMDKKSQASFRTKMRHSWDLWQKNPNDPRLSKGELRTYLTQSQEMLARSFEQYLSRDSSPTAALDPLFKQFKAAYAKYYKEIAKIKKPRYQVDLKLATIFDKMIAGEQALIRPVSRQVILTNEDGTKVEYTLHQSRAKSEKHKTIMKYLERASMDIAGLHNQLNGYVEMMLDRVSLDYKNMIGMVRTIADAKKVINRVDKTLVQQENSVRTQRISSIRATLKNLLSKNINDDIKSLAKAILGDISVEKKTDRKLARVDDLIRIIQRDLINNNQLPAELYNISKRDINLMQEMKKKNIDQLTTVELGILENSLNDLAKYNTTMAEQHVKNQVAELNARTDRATSELKNNYRGIGKKGDKNARIASLFTRMRRTFKKERYHQLINLEMIADAGFGTDSEFYKIAQDLINGDKKKLAMARMFRDITVGINAGVNMDLVSDVTGRVSRRNRVTINAEVVSQNSQIKVVDTETGIKVALRDPNKRSTKRKDISFTKAELMMIYGYTLNEDAYRHLLGGLVLPKDPDNIYRLTQEEISTLLSQLDQQYKDIVHKTMEFYDSIVAPAINEVSMRLIGRNIAQESNYLPLFVSYFGRQNLEALNMSQLDSQVEGFTKQLIEHMNFLNTRVGGSNPIHVMDFYEGTSRNLSKVAAYVGMAEPLRAAKSLLFSDKGPGKDSVYNGLGRVLGNEQRGELEEWIRALESPPTDTNKVLRSLTWLGRRAQLGALKLSVPIALLQTVSFPVGARLSGIPHRFIAAVTAKGVFDPMSLGVTMKFTMKDMAAISSIMDDRFGHTFVTGLRDTSASFVSRKQWMSPETFMAEVVNMRNFKDVWNLAKRVENGGAFLIRFMDAWAISKLLEATEMWGESEGWTQEQITEKWEDAVTRTQPMSNRMYQDNFLATASPFKRVLFGLFQSQISAYRGVRQRSLQHISNVRNSRRYIVKPKSKKIVDQLAAKAATTNLQAKEIGKSAEDLYLIYVGAAFLIASIQTMFNRMGKDDEELEGITENLLVDIIMRMITNNISAFAPITGDIGAGMVNNIVRGWNPETFGFIALDGGAQAMTTFTQGLTKLENGDIDEGTYDILLASAQAAKVLGSGIANLMRDAEKLGKELTK